MVQTSTIGIRRDTRELLKALGKKGDTYDELIRLLESQKEIVNSFQSLWVPAIERTYGVFWNYWTSPRKITDIYARVVSNIADNTIAATKLVNNTVFSNLDAFKTCIQNTRDNLKEVSRIGVNAARTFEQTSRDNTTTAPRQVGF